MTAVLQLLVPLLLAAIAPVQAAGPSNGDLRLVNSTGGPSALEGALQIYLATNGTWGAVCVRAGSNKELYNTVCQQLGYTGADGTGSYVTNVSVNNVTNDEFPAPLLTGVQCSSVYPHLLRCGYTLVTDVMEDICEDGTGVPYVTCMSSNLTSSGPYPGQVALFYGEWSSEGLLQVYLNNRWGTVCSEFFTLANGDSVCQQLGYTNALYYGPYSQYGIRWIWLRELNATCNSSCFKDCYTAPTIRNIYCSNRDDVYLVCTFDTTRYDSSLPYGRNCSLEYGTLTAAFIAVLMILFCLIVSVYIIIFIMRVVVAAYHKTEHYKLKDKRHRNRRHDFDEYRSSLDENSMILSNDYTVKD
ncbi:PREDICTED: scavenger receptor cysteine-rich type 1 protein M130-like [Amphimedon queenslandica]|uniref:SRCR domain-containing protein n=1 Tax=Amphimedon queenslandica TaxID=400682 RepID=A0A1X7UA14_AMPQE|nr:PREDICTED: scavenger receptor cysteine-rich type 1 protein M130-like [Amphimedon queenslandica]|eukprot:XP_003388589.1 PREDICTED: scavenger receptor cysteine-rich type 1 protein M130-like [Amphimedon queenslandica]